MADDLRARLEAEVWALGARVATCEHALHAAPIGCPYCHRDRRLLALLSAALTALDERESTWRTKREAQWKRENPMGSTVINTCPVAVLDAEDAALDKMRHERDEARSVARVLAHAYQTDSRPPHGVVRTGLAYPVWPLAQL